MSPIKAHLFLGVPKWLAFNLLPDHSKKSLKTSGVFGNFSVTNQLKSSGNKLNVIRFRTPKNKCVIKANKCTAQNTQSRGAKVPKRAILVTKSCFFRKSFLQYNFLRYKASKVFQIFQKLQIYNFFGNIHTKNLPLTCPRFYEPGIT